MDEEVALGRYQGKYFDSTGRECSVGSWKRDGDAQKVADEEERRSKLADYIPPDHRKLVFGSWAEKQMATRLNVTPGTAKRDGDHFRLYIMPTFGHLTLGEINCDVLQDWVNSLKQRGLAHRTVRHADLLMRQLLKKAVRSKLLATSPHEGITLPRIEDEEQRWISPSELELLAGETPPAFRAIDLHRRLPRTPVGRAGSPSDERISTH